MKSLNEIYLNIRQKFYDKSNIDVAENTVVDFYTLASAGGLEEAYKEIDDSKNPHIYTNLKGSDCDSEGLLVGCSRRSGESDESYLYRMMNWTHNNEASNRIAIENALIGLTYASNATYIPYTQGVGTATVYIIPKSYDTAGMEAAISEVKSRIYNVVSPGSHIDYVVPTVRQVSISIYIDTGSGDSNLIKENISKKVATYINGIAPGAYMQVGDINRIGLNELGVSYFNVAQLYIDSVSTTSISILQKIESKLLFKDITWWTAVK